MSKAVKKKKAPQPEEELFTEDIFSSTLNNDESAVTEPEVMTEAMPEDPADEVPASTSQYSDEAVTNMDKIIKAISFIVALGVLLIFLALAAVLVFLDKTFFVIAIGVAVLGVIFALIFLFLIYGIGHILTQNNEILKRL